MKLQRGRVSLWLEPLCERGGPKLLLLHALGGSSADFAGAELEWPGSLYALDFSGHGRSGRIVGGSYQPELLAADADAALAQLGTASVLGVGIGAYAALLLAGARGARVPAAVLCRGEGFAGGGSDFAPLQVPMFGPLQRADVSHDLQETPHTDEVAIACMRGDLRPDDYAPKFAAAAARVVLVDDGTELPPWCKAVAAVPGVSVVRERAEALRSIAG